jgi:hypothetical protein
MTSIKHLDVSSDAFMNRASIYPFNLIMIFNALATSIVHRDHLKSGSYNPRCSLVVIILMD